MILASLALGLVALKPGPPTTQGKPVPFRTPEQKVSVGNRIFPSMSWVSAQWTNDGDKPFQSVTTEIAKHKTFQGFDATGTWAAKVRTAYSDWFADCQNPVKLFRVSAYFGVLKEQDNKAARSEAFLDMWTNIRHGWHTFKGAPKSYRFVRQGYRSLAGDWDRHLFGELAKRLLARDPLDRPVFAAAVGELWDERPQWNEKLKKTVQLPSKGKEFEDLLIKTGNQIRMTERWRPWDESIFAKLYTARAIRTKSISDLDTALAFNAKAMKACPPEFDKAQYTDMERLIELLKARLKNPS